VTDQVGSCVRRILETDFVSLTTGFVCKKAFGDELLVVCFCDSLQKNKKNGY
jgi:hypothetical protein